MRKSNNMPYGIQNFAGGKTSVSLWILENIMVDGRLTTHA
jgi:hypothetical protein